MDTFSRIWKRIPEEDETLPELIGNWHLNINNFIQDLITIDKNPKMINSELINKLLDNKTPEVILNIACRYLLKNVASIFNHKACGFPLNEYDKYRKELLLNQKIHKLELMDKNCENYEILKAYITLNISITHHSWFQLAWIMRNINYPVLPIMDIHNKSKGDLRNEINTACEYGNLNYLKSLQLGLNKNQTEKSISQKIYEKIAEENNILLLLSQHDLPNVFYNAGKSGNQKLIEYVIDLIHEIEGIEITSIEYQITRGACFNGHTEIVKTYGQKFQGDEMLAIASLSGGNMELLNVYFPPKERCKDAIRNNGHVDVFREYILE